MNYEVFKTDEQWRQELSEFEYHGLRMAGTERAYTGELLEERRSGSYHCRGCDAFLFESDTKFDSHCGWPSFYAPQDSDAVVLLQDTSLGQVRTEVRCSSCGGHLGHVFEGEGYPTPTDLRYCINSICLELDEDPID